MYKVVIIISFSIISVISDLQTSKLCNKQYHMKVLLCGFHLNGHTLGLHPQIEKLEPPCTA